MRKATILGVLGLAGTLASPAFADEFSGWRLGASIGQEKLQSDVVYRGYFDQTKPGRLNYSIFGGWALNKYLAVEAGYKAGGKFNGNIQSNGAFPTRLVKQDTDLKSFEGSVVGAWWFTDKISVFGRAGVFYWKGEMTFSENLDIEDPASVTLFESFKDDGVEPFFGVGLQSQLDGALVRFEYQVAETSNFTATAGNAPILQLSDNKLNSLNFSIVWILH